MSAYIKAISSLEKCFMDEDIKAKKEITCASALRGEKFSFEVAYTSDERGHFPRCPLTLRVDSPISEYVRVSSVEQVPVRFPCYPTADENYLRRTPGLYPDLLVPLSQGDTVFLTSWELKSLFVEVDIPEDAAAGVYHVGISLLWKGDVFLSCGIELKIVDAVLPPETMAVSQWLHADCIADYYGTDVFSDEHFKIIGNYMKKAAENGLNMILTPVFTPPLDTAVGGERRTTQLVDVYRDGGVWRFGFSRLQKWVKIARKAGIKYFEISHLYTQWGAAHAPKIMGWEDGEFKRLFGWETDALSGEYRGFLRAFLPALISEMGRLGEDKNCVFHISDEPSLSNLEAYRAAKEQVADILDGYRITDALSNFDFYKTGTVEHPIPSTDEIAPFIDAEIDGLWTYYCGAQDNKVSNRFVAMPQARTRVIGFQFWKYNIAGFLHWGYNFWNSKESKRQIDPYQITDGDYFVPAGDCFSVYPGKNGVPYETLRLKAFAGALADARALRLAESIIGREALENTLSTLGTDVSSITFDSYPSSPDWLTSMRETVNNLIAGDAGKRRNGDTVLS